MIVQLPLKLQIEQDGTSDSKSYSAELLIGRASVLSKTIRANSVTEAESIFQNLLAEKLASLLTED